MVIQLEARYSNLTYSNLTLIQGHTKNFLAMTWDTVGNRLTTVCPDKTIRVFEPRTSTKAVLVSLHYTPLWAAELFIHIVGERSRRVRHEYCMSAMIVSCASSDIVGAVPDRWVY